MPERNVAYGTVYPGQSSAYGDRRHIRACLPIHAVPKNSGFSTAPRGIQVQVRSGALLSAKVTPPLPRMLCSGRGKPSASGRGGRILILRRTNPTESRSACCNPG